MEINANKQQKNLDIIEMLLVVMFKHQIKIKMFHFQTGKYGFHKASDQYLESLNDKFDKFMEVSQGIFGKFKLNQMDFSIQTLNDNNINKELDEFISVLKSLDNLIDKKPELLNIRDEMVADAQQFKYLLTFN